MSVIRYTLKTEHCAPVLVSNLFDGFEMVTGQGYWKGKPERSVSIVILAGPEDLSKVETLARNIREQYRQQEVWITAEPVELSRVTIDATIKGL